MGLAYRLARSKQNEPRSLGFTLSMVAGWLFIQGMGENWGLFGDVRQQTVFAVLIGLAYASPHVLREHRAIVDSTVSITK